MASQALSDEVRGQQVFHPESGNRGLFESNALARQSLAGRNEVPPGRALQQVQHRLDWKLADRPWMLRPTDSRLRSVRQGR